MNQSRKMRTLLVDDESLSRRGLELRLRVANDIDIVGQCTNGRACFLFLLNVLVLVKTVLHFFRIPVQVCSHYCVDTCICIHVRIPVQKRDFRLFGEKSNSTLSRAPK